MNEKRSIEGSGVKKIHYRLARDEQEALRRTSVVECLPSLRSSRGLLPDEMIGATIVNFGTTDEVDIEGGGLIIDYQVPGKPIINRSVFGFSEMGMWLICVLELPIHDDEPL